MLKRPNVKETEEDLLKQQEEFQKATCKSFVSEQGEGQLAKQEEPAASQPFSLIGNIVERKLDVNNSTFSAFPNGADEGFPNIFHVDPSDGPPKKEKKKSLFARKFDEQSGKKENVKNGIVSDVIPPVAHSTGEIGEENQKVLDNMTVEEIMEEKKKLESTLDPQLLSFLKNRSKRKIECTEKSKEVVTKVSVEEVKENLLQTVDPTWLEIDKIEPEKLEWIGDIPNATALEPDKPYSARFDFNGDLQPFSTEIDVRTSLHHHGEDPARPGYTIQELYQLSRSSVLQQRILALNTLANIIRKTKMGYYDSCFDGALLKTLVESEVFFLLRFAMDDRAVTSAAVNCLHELFVNRSDEVCLDRLRNFPGEDNEPFLLVVLETDKDTEEAELKDNIVIAQDLVKGVLRTDLLIRFVYLMNNYDLDSVTISKIFGIVVRVCRHSPEACKNVNELEIFMSYLFHHVNSPDPSCESIKLLRILLSSSNLSASLATSPGFDFIFKILDSDTPLFKLKLECLALLKELIRHDLLLDKVHSFSPCFIRLLWFYVEKVDVHHGRFDFELFSGIVGAINTVVHKKISISPDYINVLQICLEKWLSQLVSVNSSNFSVFKALGSALHFFVLLYQYQGVRNQDLKFLQKMSLTLKRFLSGPFFENVVRTLPDFSHILNASSVDRDPENLPSLCSVSLNGGGYLAIVQDESPMPLMYPLLQFVLQITKISKDFEFLITIVSSHFIRFIQLVLKAKSNTAWFARYEVPFLISLLRLNSISEIDMQLAVKLISLLRTDDERVISIFDMLSASGEFNEVSHIYKAYLKKDFRDFHLHVCETFPSHWLYEPIVSEPSRILNLVTNILQKHPQFLSDVSVTFRFCHICLVLLNAENVFNPEIAQNLETCLKDVLDNFHEIDLNSITLGEKTFYELYRDLVTEYASSSYGNSLFAKVITLPMAQKFDSSYRKLLWSEYMHALRVINLPASLDNYIPIDVFTTPVDTDESLLVLYLNAVTKNVIMEKRNGFIFQVAVENIRKFMSLPDNGTKLHHFMKMRITGLKDENLKLRLLKNV